MFQFLQKKHLIKIAATCSLVLSSAAQAAPLYTNAYVFGDSLSDTGNIEDSLGFLGSILGGSIGYGSNGRFSNGPVWHEYLTLNDDLVAQDNLGISRNGGTNYAYGGALVDDGSGLTGAVALSATTQVANYLSSNPVADPDALYINWIGGNDVRGLVGDSDPWGDVNTALDELQGMLGDLLSAGATTLLVPNLPDIGSIPEFAGNAADQQSAYDITVAWNDGLENRLISLHDDFLTADIFYFDVFSLFDEMLSDPATYGFTDVTSECRSVNFTQESACADADSTLFWDYVHPTTAAHQLLGEYAANTLRNGSPVPLPSTLLLLLCGLGLMGGARARAKK